MSHDVMQEALIAMSGHGAWSTGRRAGAYHATGYGKRAGSRSLALVEADRRKPSPC